MAHRPARKRKAPERFDEPHNEVAPLQPPSKTGAETQTIDASVEGQPGIPGVPPFSGEHEEHQTVSAYFHYTNGNGLKGIADSSIIRASKGGRYGPGVYLTKWDPRIT